MNDRSLWKQLKDFALCTGFIVVGFWLAYAYG